MYKTILQHLSYLSSDHILNIACILNQNSQYVSKIKHFLYLTF